MRVTLADGETIEAEVLLVAVGRGPVTAGLGYEEVGRRDGPRLCPSTRRADQRAHVYAVGDIVPGLQLAHRGFQQGIFVAEQIAGLNPTPIDEAGIPRVTYCDPEVASVGLTEAKAKEKYGDGRDRSTTTSAAMARARSSRPPASSSSSGSRTVPWSASTWSAPGSASRSAKPS